jgi:hypothetical protein
MSDDVRPATDLDQTSRLAAFKSPSVVISLAAFLISIVTTGASAYRTYRQDIEAQKTQLRSVLMQLTSVDLQGQEFTAKYSNNSALPSMRSSLYAQKIFLTKQAYILVREVGDDASAVDLVATAHSLAEAGEMALGEELAIKALGKSKNAVEYVAAARNLSIMKLAAQQGAEAEKYRQMALHVFDVFPNDAISENHANSVHAYTNIYLASHSNDCAISLTYVADADQYIEALGVHVTPGAMEWRNKVVGTCSKKEAASGAAPPSQRTGQRTAATTDIP